MPYSDPKKKAEYMRKYQQKNKDKINEINKRSRQTANRADKDREKYALDEEYREKIKQRNSAQYQKHKQKRTDTQRERRRQRRLLMIERLGGKCCGCGTTENLQFDHLDRTQKTGSVSKMLDLSLEKLIEEVDKCQLLCYACHEYKSLINHDKDKLAEGYRVSKVDRLGDKIIVTLEPAVSVVRR